MNPARQAAIMAENAHSRGIVEGHTLTLWLALISAYNVYEPYMDGAQFKAFFGDWEAEVERIFREECNGDPSEIALMIQGKTEDLRRKMGIDETENNL